MTVNDTNARMSFICFLYSTPHPAPARAPSEAPTFSFTSAMMFAGSVFVAAS